FRSGGIQDRERDRRQEGRREQLHRQAVQRRHAEDQDRGGLPGYGDGVKAKEVTQVLSIRVRHARPRAGHPRSQGAAKSFGYQRSSRMSARGGWPNSSFTEAGSSWSMPSNSSEWMPRVTNRQSIPKPCAPARSVRTESPIASTRLSCGLRPERSVASAIARS